MKLSQHCFAVTGLYFIPPWTVNAGFIIGSEKTLVVDSGGTTLSAQTIYGYSKSLKPENELILINTEKHLDHIGGNSYFFDNDVEIYGHGLINRNQREFEDMVNHENKAIPEDERRSRGEGLIAFQGTKIVNPTKKLSQDTDIDLGGIVAHVRMTPGHTETNISIIVGRDRVVFCGDCIVQRYLPNTAEANIQQWRESLKLIRETEPEILVPGHGNVIFGRDNIVEEIDRIDHYLENIH